MESNASDKDKITEAQVKEVHRHLEPVRGGDKAERGTKPSGKWGGRGSGAGTWALERSSQQPPRRPFEKSLSGWGAVAGGQVRAPWSKARQDTGP